MAFEALGRPETFVQAFESVRDGGRMVGVGIAAGKTAAPIGITHLVRRGIRVIGSFGARTRADMPEIIRLAAAKESRRGQTNDFWHVSSGASAIRADDAQAATDETGNFDPGRRAAGRNAHGHHATAVPDDFERLHERLRPSEHLERHVNALAVRQLFHLFGDVARAGVDDVGGAVPARALELVITHVDGDDLRGAEGFGNLNDIHAHATRCDDSDTFATPKVRRMTHGAVGREDRTAEHRRFEEWQRRR